MYPPETSWAKRVGIAKIMRLRRVDIVLCEQGLTRSREQAKDLIGQGSVWHRGLPILKPSTLIDPSSMLELQQTQKHFSSRAGKKLEHALETFSVDVRQRVALDIGVSTGGFTDCLLTRGASHVFAVDVAYGLIDYRLRTDPRVILLERTNARYLTKSELTERNSCAEQIDIVTIDVSFISIQKILPNILSLLTRKTDWVLLFKPQFEVEKTALKKGGRVRDPAYIDEALANFHHFMEGLKLERRHAVEPSPVPGKKSGNVEYLLHYVSSGKIL